MKPESKKPEPDFDQLFRLVCKRIREEAERKACHRMQEVKRTGILRLDPEIFQFSKP